MHESHFRRARRAMVAVAAMVTLIGASACAASKTSGPTSGPTSTPPTKSSAPTPWQQTLAQVKPDGTVDTATALSAFAQAIAPVPGVTPPAGDRNDISSGTVAIRWITRVWTKLSEQQRQAVQMTLTVATHSIRAGALAPPKLDPNGPNVPCQAADSEGASAYRALVDDAAAKISARLGRSLPTPPVVLVDTLARPGSPAYMYTYGCSGKSQTNSAGQGCTIHIATGANLHPANSPDTSSALAHEVTHCFVVARIGALAESRLPDWYGEGLPNWVASSIGAVGSIITDHWHSYLDSPTTPLAQRAYSGIGFFVHLAETGVDPWPVIDKMADAMAGGAGTAAGWKAAGVSTAFLDSWGSGFVQGPAAWPAPPGGRPARTWTPTSPTSTPRRAARSSTASR
jgi:hypothetical protein